MSKKIVHRVLILIFLIGTTCFKSQCQNTTVLIKTQLGNIKVLLYNDTPKHRDKFIKEAEKGYYDGSLFYRVVKDFIIQGGAKASKNAPRSQSIGYGNPDFTVDDEIRSNHFHKRGALCAPRQPDDQNPFKQSDISQFYIVTGKVFRSTQLDTMEMAVNNPIRKEMLHRYYTPEIQKKLKELKAAKKVDEFRAIANPIKRKIESQTILDPDYLEYSKEQREAYTTIGGCPELDGDFTVFGEVISGMDVVERISRLKIDKNARPYTDVKIEIDVQ